jgi:hypothetical protein
MTLSKPAGNAAAAAPAYARALLDLLGSREPLDVLPELMPWLGRRLVGVPEAQLRRPEAPGKWSAIAIVQHLADSELILSVRLWRRLAPGELGRQGMHRERGPESLGHLLRLMAAHDLVHRRQIDRVLAPA